MEYTNNQPYSYRAILVEVLFHRTTDDQEGVEFISLVRSADIQVLEILVCKKVTPHPKYFIGSGKLDEIHHKTRTQEANLIIFNQNLTPSQERNLAKFLQCEVLDRTELILHIFAQRARSYEGKLQVELAQLQHLSTRLVRGWTHLERQKGGIGLRGPGETQLETDRRLVGNRIKQLRKRLEQVRKQRNQSRYARHKAKVATISLVGYTNAGKSTLFNCLTKSQVFADNKLFATLDPTLRKLHLEANHSLVLADTVGFIRDLPHSLIDAFYATLEEIKESTLLLHIVDCSSEDRKDLVNQVNKVLSEIGADDIPCIEVYNKIDQISDIKPKIERNEAGNINKVWLSAFQDKSLALLKQALIEFFKVGKSIENSNMDLPVRTISL
ncbi:ribosome rescue GTPase HflX [Candidatus Nitrosacidococcus sp. I8]|uniref:ribosome rescue GTPase HflX n=1 Tax=Candidatus Nitrosacidococcus sp. I8 TaxID=2942908 RepID=UPI002227621C|nr:ribosome rescue GTPase HflX [Candidatus Nitrosacidococcus sp. I8]CAH9019685.1 GTPase HflX [Candidatus Nitrosacidococcus sp. I8]